LNYGVLLQLATNPKTPVAILEQLADQSTSLREVVATNTAITPALAKKLTKGKYANTLLGLAKNPSTPAEILEELAKNFERFGEALAQNPSTPLDMLQQLAAYGPDHGAWVARNPSTPLDMLQEIAQRCDYAGSVAERTLKAREAQPHA
jgi:pentose-5-phosphate-3-epimerase